MPTSRPPLTIEHVLLGLLVPAPLHAYEIYRTLRQQPALAAIWHLKQSHCYALLARLEAEAYLSGHTEAQGARPPRRVLALTPTGQYAFAAWCTAPVTHARDLRQEFLAKLYFVFGDPSARTQLVRAQLAVISARIDALEARADTLDPQSFDHALLRFRLGQLDAVLAWLDTLDARQAAPPLRVGEGAGGEVGEV